LTTAFFETIRQGIEDWLTEILPHVKVVTIGGESHDLYDSQGLHIRGKVLDGGFEVLIPEAAIKTYPNITFEISYSENYQELLDNV
jgi:hypothetical protein